MMTKPQVVKPERPKRGTPNGPAVEVRRRARREDMPGLQRFARWAKNPIAETWWQSKNQLEAR